MKVQKVIIQNFRAYKKITFSTSNLNLFVGKNDAGKSTVLEALDIFFNGKAANKKIDKNDRYKNNESDIIISVCFSDFPDKVIIDDTNETNLKDEKLLNEENLLEITKKYTGSMLKESTFIYAEHPTSEKAKDLLLKKQKDLKKIVADNGYHCDDLKKNAELRKSIWENCGNLESKKIEIAVDKEDGKKIWDKLSNYLPIYALFQSDRANNDSDTEVQDPIKVAIKEILSDEKLQKTLNQIAEDVKRKTKEITDGALKKLTEMDPKIAKNLKTIIPETKSLKWADVFKGITISSDDNIPLNKRGSGVKRLILLNFFRIQEERKHKNSKNIIYAIEEPETSQHLEYQKSLIETFKKLSEKNIQVFLTSHSTKIVSMLFSNDGKISEGFKILHVKKNEHSSVINEKSKNFLPYTSANEINYRVFEVYETEFHSELYGYLEKENNNELCKLKETKEWINIKSNKTQNISLSKYIRHSIHHPENEKNELYSAAELKKSIDTMFDLLKKDQTH